MLYFNGVKKDEFILNNFLKRAFDILFSLLMLIVSSPVLIIVSIIVKKSSKGPILYSGKRLGKNKKIINVLKFRTMYIGADSMLKDVLASCPKKQKEWQEFQKLADDPRCTPIGKFLRKTSLDEFPQFLNVLKGDLSIVGPRPYLTSELKQWETTNMDSKAHVIFRVKPGITCTWQISGRNTLTHDAKIKLDMIYSLRNSFSTDLIIVFKTVYKVLTLNGAM